MRKRCEVHFEGFEGFIFQLGHRVGLQYNLSSMDQWINIEGQQDTRGHVEDICDASTVKVGRVSSTNSVHLKK